MNTSEWSPSTARLRAGSPIPCTALDHLRHQNSTHTSPRPPPASMSTGRVQSLSVELALPTVPSVITQPHSTYQVPRAPLRAHLCHSSPVRARSTLWRCTPSERGMKAPATWRSPGTRGHTFPGGWCNCCALQISPNCSGPSCTSPDHRAEDANLSKPRG